MHSTADSGHCLSSTAQLRMKTEPRKFIPKMTWSTARTVRTSDTPAVEWGRFVFMPRLGARGPSGSGTAVEGARCRLDGPACESCVPGCARFN